MQRAIEYTYIYMFCTFSVAADMKCVRIFFVLVFTFSLLLFCLPIYYLYSCLPFFNQIAIIVCQYIILIVANFTSAILRIFCVGFFHCASDCKWAVSEWEPKCWFLSQNENRLISKSTFISNAENKKQKNQSISQLGHYNRGFENNSNTYIHEIKKKSGSDHRWIVSQSTTKISVESFVHLIALCQLELHFECFNFHLFPYLHAFSSRSFFSSFPLVCLYFIWCVNNNREICTGIQTDYAFNFNWTIQWTMKNEQKKKKKKSSSQTIGMPTAVLSTTATIIII